MSASDVIARVRITQVVEALGGKIRNERCQAFERKGDGWNVSLNDDKDTWFDHARGEGGGVLDLVQRVRGCDRKEALQWVADIVGVPLESGLTQEQRREYAKKAQAAKAEALALLEWRNRLVERWRQLRNEYFRIYHDARRLIAAVGLESDVGQSLGRPSFPAADHLNTSMPSSPRGVQTPRSYRRARPKRLLFVFFAMPERLEIWGLWIGRLTAPFFVYNSPSAR